MRFCKDANRPHVSIPPTTRRPPTPSWQYTANPSDERYAPYAFEVMPPDTNSEIPSLDNPWPYQQATPDTSMARARSMVELSGRSQSYTGPTTAANDYLAFPELQPSRSISHSPTQESATTARHRALSNHTSPTSLGFHRQVSTSSFQSTASSYWENAVSDPEVCLRVQKSRYALSHLVFFQLSPGYEDLSCELSKMLYVICHLLVNWPCWSCKPFF